MFPRIFPTENKIAKVDQPTKPVVFGQRVICFDIFCISLEQNVQKSINLASVRP